MAKAPAVAENPVVEETTEVTPEVTEEVALSEATLLEMQTGRAALEKHAGSAAAE